MELSHTTEDLACYGVSDALKETSIVFKEFTSKINKISSDIKEVEKTLQGYGICIPFSMKIESLGWWTRTGGDIDQLFERSNHLSWIEQNGVFRLAFCQIEQDGYENSEGHNCLKRGEDAIFRTSIQPLIETKVQTRINSYPYLALFLREMAAKAVIVEEEIPF